MDLSWCIICDRHCTEDNLYCSEPCRIKDKSLKPACVVSPVSSTTGLYTPPASPLLEPFLSSFKHERRTSIKPINILSMSPSSIPKYSLY
ncbi:hypothetical protein BY458DRAFT_496203 [Sporodiniella umbellata]|nr:hypothetical protein BY458DRAFT_496203 [Sporodiniella umbellata]